MKYEFNNYMHLSIPKVASYFSKGMISSNPIHEMVLYANIIPRGKVSRTRGMKGEAVRDQELVALAKLVTEWAKLVTDQGCLVK